MKEKYLTNEQIRNQGLEAVLEKLGPDGLVRFLQQFEPGSGDYSKERASLVKGLTVDKILGRMQAVRKGKSTGA